MTIYRVTIDQTMFGQQLQNVLHFSHFSSDPATMSLLADAVEASWIGNIRMLHSGSVRYNRIRVRMLESQFATFEKTVNIGGNWGAVNEIWSFVCFVLRLRTAIHGRTGRGRIYISGVLAGFTDKGFVTSDQIVAFNTRIAFIMEVFGPGGSSDFKLGVCNKNPPFAFKEVTSMQVAPVTGCQRRRNVGVGI